MEAGLNLLMSVQNIEGGIRTWNSEKNRRRQGRNVKTGGEEDMRGEKRIFI